MLVGCLSASAANEVFAGPELAWSIVPSPQKAGVKLYGISASSLTQAWAVGDIYSPLTPIVYRWNGSEATADGKIDLVEGSKPAPNAKPKDPMGIVYPAGIATSRDGRFLFL